MDSLTAVHPLADGHGAIEAMPETAQPNTVTTRIRADGREPRYRCPIFFHTRSFRILRPLEYGPYSGRVSGHGNLLAGPTKGRWLLECEECGDTFPADVDAKAVPVDREAF